MASKMRSIAWTVLAVLAALLSSIQTFAADYVLLIDCSGSMNHRVKGLFGPTKMDVVSEALKNYLAQLPLESRIYLAAFNEFIHPQREVVLTSENDRADLIACIPLIKNLTANEQTGAAQTHLWAALEHGLEKGSSFLRDRPENIVAVRVLTDGFNNDKKTKWQNIEVKEAFKALEREFPEIGGNINANLVMLGSFDVQLSGKISIIPVPDFRPSFPPTITNSPPYPKTGEPTSIIDASKQAFDSYDWYVNGQLASRDRNFKYTFTKPGPNLVTLSVISRNGQREQASKSIQVSEPEKPEPMNPSITVVPSDPEPSQTVKFFGRVTGKPTEVKWLEGTSQIATGLSLERTFAREGEHEITLAVRDAAGNEDRTTTKINVAEKPLSVVFHAPSEVIAGNVVNFSNQTLGTSIDWTWNFGDNTTSTEKNPTHIFQNSKNDPTPFAVVLNAKTSMGHSYRSEPLIINVHPAPKPPKSSFKISQNEIRAGSTIRFLNDSKGGVVTNSQWDFNKEGSSDQRDAEYTFNTAGPKTITLTVTGPGGTDRTIQTINVLPQIINITVSLLTSKLPGLENLPNQIDFGKINPTHLKAGTLVGLGDDTIQIQFPTDTLGGSALVVNLASTTNAFKLSRRMDGIAHPLKLPARIVENTLLYVTLDRNSEEKLHESVLTLSPEGEATLINGKASPISLNLRADLRSESLSGLLFLVLATLIIIGIWIGWKQIVSGAVIDENSIVTITLTEIPKNPSLGQTTPKRDIKIAPNETIRFGVNNSPADHTFDLKAPDSGIRRDRSTVRLTIPNQKVRDLIKSGEYLASITGIDRSTRQVLIRTTYNNPVKTATQRSPSDRNTKHRR